MALLTSLATRAKVRTEAEVAAEAEAVVSAVADDVRGKGGESVEEDGPAGDAIETALVAVVVVSRVPRVVDLEAHGPGQHRVIVASRAVQETSAQW